MDEEWYYCVEHETVEPRIGCGITTRLGPFPTREEASRALEIVAERNREWEEAEEEWEEDEY